MIGGHNTIESLKEACSEPGWDGYDGIPLSEEVIARARAIEPYIPKDEKWELFAGPDGSLQYEDQYDDDKFFIEVYPDKYYIEELDTGAEITFNFPETVQTLLKMYEHRKARRKENVDTSTSPSINVGALYGFKF